MVTDILSFAECYILCYTNEENTDIIVPVCHKYDHVGAGL